MTEPVATAAGSTERARVRASGRESAVHHATPAHPAAAVHRTGRATGSASRATTSSAITAISGPANRTAARLRASSPCSGAPAPPLPSRGRTSTSVRGAPGIRSRAIASASARPPRTRLPTSKRPSRTAHRYRRRLSRPDAPQEGVVCTCQVGSSTRSVSSRPLQWSYSSKPPWRAASASSQDASTSARHGEPDTGTVTSWNHESALAGRPSARRVTRSRLASSSPNSQPSSAYRSRARRQATGPPRTSASTPTRQSGARPGTGGRQRATYWVRIACTS